MKVTITTQEPYGERVIDLKDAEPEELREVRALVEGYLAQAEIEGRYLP